MMSQAHNCDPVSFLQIWDSYQSHLKHLARQKTVVSDTPIEIKLETRPLIVLSNSPGEISNAKYQSGASEDIKSVLLGQARLSVAKHL